MLDFLLITLKKAFDTWKTDWTASRAQKIDTIENRLSSTRMTILDGLNNRLNSIERALNGKVNQVSIENLTKKVDGVINAIASKASQTSLEEAKLVIEDLGDRLTTKRTKNLDNLDTTVSSRADQTSIDEIKKLLVPNREFKFFYKHDLTGSSLNRDITLVDINGKSGEFLAFETFVSEKAKTVNATIKIIVDGVTVIDIDYRQELTTESYDTGDFSLLIAPIESIYGGNYENSNYTGNVGRSIFNLSNKRLTSAAGYQLETRVSGLLPIDKIPFKRSLKVIISSNTRIHYLKASCYINK